MTDQTTTITVEDVHFEHDGKATIIGRDADGRRTEAVIDQARGSRLASELEASEDASPTVTVQSSDLS